MMSPRGKEFIDELDSCISQLFSEHQNGTTSNTNLNITTPEMCNSSAFGRIESYVTPLWESNFLLALIYCVIVGVAMCVGLFGNIIILIISATTRTMNRIGRAFVINLALADLCIAAVADPMCIIGVVKGERWFQGRWLLCEVVASMCLTACFCAFLNLSLLTFNRYVFVCLNQWYDKIFKRPVCVLMCILTWGAAFMFEFPNFTGWGDHYFDEQSHQCIWDRTASFSYTMVVTAGLIGGPLVLMFIGFVLIFYKIYKSKKDVFSLNLDDPLRMSRVWRESWRSSRTLVIVFLAFVVCWTPYATITAIDVNNSFSTETHLLVTLLAHVHSSLNFTIYMCSNEAFRRSAFAVMRCSPTFWKYRNSLKVRSHLNSSSDKTTSSTDFASRQFFSRYIADDFHKGLAFGIHSTTAKDIDSKSFGETYSSEIDSKSVDEGFCSQRDNKSDGEAYRSVSKDNPERF